MPDHTILEGSSPDENPSGGTSGDSSTIIEGTSVDSSTIIEGTQARAEAGFNLVPGGVFEGYTLLRPLEVTSGEADLWFIADAQGVEYVLKLYRYGIKPKKEITEKIRALGHQHSVRVIADGATSGRSFEILEKIEHGDLTRFVTGQPLSDEWLREVLKDLGNAVAHLHQVGILHRDIKPANILVRSVDPLDLVLTDFGISSLSDGSLHMTTVNRTAAYCAPEAMQGVVAGASDWWSVGVIILEMLKGRHPFTGMDERAVNFQLVAKGISVPDDIPEDWKLLVKGLLTRDPDQRWAWDQLAGWLEGRRDMPLYYQEAQSAQAHGHKPYKINEKECFTATELATELGQDWEAGKANLGRGMIASWVEGQLSDQGLAVNLHEINENESWDSDDKLSAALMAMAPELPPFFKGEVVSLEWLANNPARAVEVCESRLPQLQARYRPKGEPNLTGISERVKQVIKSKDESGRLAGSTQDLVISMAVDPAYPIKLGDEPISTMEWMAAHPKRAVKILEGPLPDWQARLTDGTSLNDALEGLKGWRNAIEQTGVEVDPGKVHELVLNYHVEGGPEELQRRYMALAEKFQQGIYAGSSDEKLQAIIGGGEIGPVEQMVMLAVDESLYLTPQNKYLQDYALPMDWELADQLIKANSWETLTPMWTGAVQNPQSVSLLNQPEYQRCHQTLHSQSPEYLDVVAMLAVLSELKGADLDAFADEDWKTFVATAPAIAIHAPAPDPPSPEAPSVSEHHHDELGVEAKEGCGTKLIYAACVFIGMVGLVGLLGLLDEKVTSSPAIGSDGGGDSGDNTFAAMVEPIFKTSICYDCHDGSRATNRTTKAGLDLTNRDSVRNVIEPGNPDQSELILRLTDVEDPMPPDGKGGMLSADDVDEIKAWIKAGAKF